MAKKSSTIHIEQCFWDLIEDYQKNNGMDSRNLAIECLLSEYKALKSITQVNFNSQGNLPDVHINNSYTGNEDKHDPIREKLLKMESEMAD